MKRTVATKHLLKVVESDRENQDRTGEESGSRGETGKIEKAVAIDRGDPWRDRRD